MAPEDKRIPVEIPVNNTASNLNPEHKLSYFREDMGVNSHHWHWHLTYPTSGATRSTFDKNRRGELFYYMHQQVLARYNLARFSDGLNRVVKFDDLSKPIKSGYYPKMTNLNASRPQPVRQDDTVLKSLNRTFDSPELAVKDLQRWIERIVESIDRGYCIDSNNNPVPLNNPEGIDILGNIIESCDLSINRGFYGDIHNTGHVFFSYCHDPDGKFNEMAAVMSDTSTAMRDPIFYQWHAFVDSLFHRHKTMLPPYTPQDLTFTDVVCNSMELVQNGALTDELHTYWMKSDINLSRGLDFAAPGNVYVRMTHLNYEYFSYKYESTVNIVAITKTHNKFNLLFLG